MSRSSYFIAVSAFALALSGCDTGGSAEGTRYQQWAQTVSTIPLDPATGQTEAPQSRIALEPAHEKSSNKALRVELMTPHQLWDARNGPLKVPTMEVLENISPTEMVRTAVAVANPSPQPSEERASANINAATATKLIQLGAYSSEQAARHAWQRVQSSVGPAQSSGLEPRFETVEVSGRQLVRLRVATTDDQARSLCQALASDDPWCKSPS